MRRLLLAAALVLGSAGIAQAGPHDSIALVGSQTFGAQVTFDVSTHATDRPWVWNRCYQGATLVSAEVHDMTPGAFFGNVFSLGPTTLWQGGDAECIAELQDRDSSHDRVLASLLYHVEG